MPVPAHDTKRISIDDLAVGMYIAGLDLPWLQSPFLLHRRRIRRSEDIARLKAYGVQQVTIDTSRGLDLGRAVSTPGTAPLASSPSAPEPPAAGGSGASAAAPLPAAAPGVPQPELALVRTVHTEAMTAVHSLFEGARTGTPLSQGAVQEVVHGLLATVLTHPATLMGLIHMRQFEANLYAHAVNVCALALMLGSHQELDDPTLTRLGMGALLHDVGQVYLPLNLLRRARVYTAQEQRLMQAHAHLGATMLAQDARMDVAVCRIVDEHHERQDGSGYPQGRHGAMLSRLSQTVAIADVYESMLSHREGRPPLLPAQAMKELYQHGRAQQLDLELVEHMVRCLGIYPMGSLVELSTGERGLVIADNPGQALRPVVRILWDPAQQHYAAPLTVNLAAPETTMPGRTILRVLDPAVEGYDIAACWQESTGV